MPYLEIAILRDTAARTQSGDLGDLGDWAKYTRHVLMRVAAILICGCWWIAEYVRSSTRDRASTVPLDKGSSAVWDAAHFLGVIGAVVGFRTVGRIRHGAELIAVAGLCLMLAGISVRSLAIRTLGPYFTAKVSALENHRLIETGLYRHLRHPSYSGSLLAYLGMGLALANWISTGLIFMPVLAVALYRIRVEERALREIFPDAYAAYSARSKRILPAIY
jgi:protein-S-isoprenylcysteine O-methyltransferase Ste14